MWPEDVEDWPEISGKRRVVMRLSEAKKDDEEVAGVSEQVVLNKEGTEKNLDHEHG